MHKLCATAAVDLEDGNGLATTEQQTSCLCPSFCCHTLTRLNTTRTTHHSVPRPSRVHILLIAAASKAQFRPCIQSSLGPSSQSYPSVMVNNELEHQQLQSFPSPSSPSSSTSPASVAVAWLRRNGEKLRRVREDLRDKGQQMPRSHKAAAALLLSLLAALYYGRSKDAVQVHAQRTELSETIMALLSLDDSSAFKSTWATHNGHAATLHGYLRPHPPSLPCTRELVHTDDGGHFSFEWYSERVGATENVATLREDLRTRPIVLLLHGVNDSGQHPYMKHMAHVVATQKGWRAVCMTYRGCGSLNLSSPQAYDAATTNDVALAVETIRTRFPTAPLFMVGFSLGANIMVKYLGEEGPKALGKISGAVAISNPWAFHPHIESLHYTSNPKSFRRISAWVYSILVASEYKKYVRRHQRQLADRLKELQRPLESFTTLRELDENVTVPLNGWRDLEHYMTTASSSNYLEGVAVPLLGINALDDPLVSREALEFTVEKASRNRNVILVTTTRGGHIGWGGQAKRASWAESLAVDFMHASAKVHGLVPDREEPGKGLERPRARL